MLVPGAGIIWFSTWTPPTQPPPSLLRRAVSTLLFWIRFRCSCTPPRPTRICLNVPCAYLSLRRTRRVVVFPSVITLSISAASTCGFTLTPLAPSADLPSTPKPQSRQAGIQPTSWFRWLKQRADRLPLCAPHASTTKIARVGCVLPRRWGHPQLGVEGSPVSLQACQLKFPGGTRILDYQRTSHCWTRRRLGCKNHQEVVYFHWRESLAGTENRCSLLHQSLVSVAGLWLSSRPTSSEAQKTLSRFRLRLSLSLGLRGESDRCRESHATANQTGCTKHYASVVDGGDHASTWQISTRGGFSATCDGRRCLTCRYWRIHLLIFFLFPLLELPIWLVPFD